MHNTLLLVEVTADSGPMGIGHGGAGGGCLERWPLTSAAAADDTLPTQRTARWS